MRRNSQAFTLLEILVAVVLLSMMVLIVSTVLSESSRVVTIAEKKIRQNNAAASLAQSIRMDLLRASKNGFLCITQDGLWRPRLILTSAGASSSVTGNARGTGVFTMLGLVDNQAAPGDPNARLLWMPSYVMTGSPSGTYSGYDVWYSMDFATVQILKRSEINGYIGYSGIINHPFCTGTVGNIRVPPVTIDDVTQRLWQVAATGVSRLSIMWTDGNMAGGTLNWYGVDINGNVKSQVPDPAWRTRNYTMLDNDPTIIEYDGGQSGPLGPGHYRALWSHHNQNLWPKAIKIRFTVTDAAMPPEFQNADYEVIATIGQ